MPQSRARTAICSAPLEWPSRPGLPTSSLMRRPSLAETRSTSARTSSRLASPVRGHGAADAGRRAIFAEDAAQRRAPFAGGDAGLGAGDRRLHDVAAFLGGALQIGSAALTALASRAARQASRRSICSSSIRVDGLDGACCRRQRRRLRLGPAVDADNDLLARLDLPQALARCSRPGALHVVDGRDRAAHPSMRVSSCRGRGFSSATLRSITFEPSKMSPYSSRSVS